MPGMYEKHGIRFLFPENWTLEEEPQGDRQWTVSVQNPQTAFWSITLDDSGQSAVELAAAAVQAYRDEYGMLDVTDVEERLGSWNVVGHNLAFFCLDFTNTCWIRAFRAGSRSILILFQANDSEWDAMERVFRAIGASLRVLGTGEHC